MAPRPRCRASSLARLMAALWCGLLAEAPSSAAPREAGQISTPTLWRATSPEGRVAFYLLGSIHVGRPGMLEFPPAIDEAYERADEVVLEITLDELTGAGESAAAERYGVIEPPASLRDRISETTLSVLSSYFERRGESLSDHLQQEPWVVTLQILAREAERAGLDPRYGVDLHFAQRAEGEKPVVGLETADAQLELLAHLPRKTQEELLLDTLEHTGEAGLGAEALVDAWARGDDAEVERIFYRPMVAAPELSIYFERLIFGRNETMTQRLASLARDGKLRFVVVGAGHMVGERGIPALLRDYGFRLERVALGATGREETE